MRWLLRLSLGLVVATSLATGWLPSGSLSSGSLWAQGQQTLLVLKDGSRIGPGYLSEHATLSTNKAVQGQANTMGNSIFGLDDDLRTTYVNRGRVDLNSLGPVSTVVEEIELPAAAEAARGEGELAILNVIRVKEFNQFGRREYTVSTPRGPQVIVQGITKLTPLYAEVQSLRDKLQQVAWNQRIGTSTISPDKLREILHHELDMSRASERMRLYRFYLQAERYIEARMELVDALAKFPELDPQKTLLVGLDQAIAANMFREIELRFRVGQPKLASELLQKFPIDMGGDGTVTETQLRVQDQLDQLKTTLAQLAELTQLLKSQLAELPPPEAEAVRPVIDQIVAELTYESRERLSDYARFGKEPTMSVDRKLAFAIGGWLLGPGAGLENFEVAKSLVRVSALVREYLSTADATRREQILESLMKEEGGRPELLGRVIGAMKPPLPLPEPDPAHPAGYYRISLPVSEASESDTIEYTIQLPPEYDPYRRYPCIVSLGGLGSPAEMAIDWWTGKVDPRTKERHGLATRYGYIVISPKWMSPEQLEYNYSAREHERVLRSLRDAYRRLSIDTNRVFIAGHFDGGGAAWDIALAHPDLWAGAIMLSAVSEKYILLNAINAALVPTYTVWGQFDGTSMRENLGKTVSEYLDSPIFDARGVEYKGRPRDHFLEELPRIIDWMEMTNHRRDPNPRKIEALASRAGDRYFFWFEMPEIDPARAIDPLAFDMRRKNKVDVSLQGGGNSFSLKGYPSKRAWIWLRPGLVNFGQAVTVSGKEGGRINRVFKGDARILMEDVRTRADRVAPFYDRIEIP